MDNDKRYAGITSRILESLKRGVVNWRIPLSMTAGTRPQSDTGHPYNGINAHLLGLSGYSDKRNRVYWHRRDAGARRPRNMHQRRLAERAGRAT